MKTKLERKTGHFRVLHISFYAIISMSSSEIWVCGLRHRYQEEWLHCLCSVLLPCSLLFMPFKQASPPVTCSSLKVKEGNHAKHVFSLFSSLLWSTKRGAISVCCLSESSRSCTRRHRMLLLPWQLKKGEKSLWKKGEEGTWWKAHKCVLKYHNSA